LVTYPPLNEEPHVGDRRESHSQRLSDIAYVKVLQGLFDRTFPAGAFLSQNDLVRLLDIPVQPLRVALRVLEAEGVLTIHPRSGIQFLKPDLELARSAYQYRTILETIAARVLAEVGDLTEVDGLIQAHLSLAREIDAEGYSSDALARLDDLEERFHGLLIANLRNPMIEITARRLKNYMILLRLDQLVTAPLLQHTIREHLDILEAVAARNPDAAAEAVDAHFQAALRRILHMF